MKVVLISWARTAQHHYSQKSKKNFRSFQEACFSLDCFKTKLYQRSEWENLGVNAKMEYKTTSWHMLALQKCCGFLCPDIAQLLQLHLNHHHHHQQQRHTGKSWSEMSWHFKCAAGVAADDHWAHSTVFGGAVSSVFLIQHLACTELGCKD